MTHGSSGKNWMKKKNATARAARRNGGSSGKNWMKKKNATARAARRNGE
jgi:hypothetical protein